ncbi:MAG: Gfo/Idh/MocA family oxidoreductase [Planctomycetota bacterium]|jgi:predicted dehydrogenase
MCEQGKSNAAGRPSRRDFLKASTTAVSAAVAGGIAVSRSAHAAGSDVLKVGLIGCGGRGSGAALDAMNADPNTRLVAMTDIFEDKVQGSRERLRKVKPDQVAVDDDHCFIGFDGYEKVIQSGVDVVLIACASRFHPKYLKAAIDAGKHVFVEKPHAIDPPGIRVVAAACEEAEKKGLSVVSGLCWRYDYGVRETMKRVMDGAIGEIIAIQETYMRSPYRLINFDPALSEIEYQYRNWYHFNWLSGDDIAQSLIHSMDKGAWAMHDEPPVKAYGVGGRAASVGRIHGDTFDHHAVMYEYAGGVRMYAIGRAQKQCYNEVSDVFLGTKGRAIMPDRCRIEGEVNWRYEGEKPRMYEVEHRELFGSIRSGKPINNKQYMVGTSMLAILGQMVLYTGKAITWEEAMKSPYRLGPEECDFQTEPPVLPDENEVYPVAVPGVTQLS